MPQPSDLRVAAVKTMGISTWTSRESAKALSSSVSVPWVITYASACLGRGRGGVRYRGDVGEREIRSGFCQHIKCFDFGKVRETWYGGDKICSTKKPLPRHPARFPWPWRWCRPSKG